MICLLALIIFSFLGIFSLTYRELAKEAFRCVLRRITLRPCDTAFDQKIKAKLTGWLFRKSPRLGAAVHKHFEALSWVFMIALVVSLIITANGVYNLVAYGSCDPHNPDNCLFTDKISCGSEHCAEEGCECGPKNTNCTPETNFAPCEGNCTCNTRICG